LRVPILTLLILVLVGAVEVSAADGDAAAVYAGSAASPVAAGRVAEALSLVRPAVSLSEAPRHLDELAPPGTLVAPGAELIQCEGDALDTAAYLDKVSSLSEAVWEVEDLDPLFDAAHASQACLTEAVAARDLARVSFVEGVMAFELGRPDAAAAAFRQVFAMDLGFPWDGQFGPGARASFDAVGAEVGSTAMLQLQVFAAPGVPVAIDGATVETAEILLSAGHHLIQVGEGADLRTALVVLQHKNTVIVDADALHHAVIEDAAPSAAAVLFGALGEGAPGYLVAMGDTKQAWRWDAATQSLEPLILPKAAQTALAPPTDDGKKRPGPATPILIAVGAGLVAGGSVIAGVTNNDLDDFGQAVEAGERFPFPAPDAANPEDYALYQEWEGKVNQLGAGYAMIAVGGVALLASIPVGLLTAQPSNRKVAFGAAILTDREADAVQGFMFTINLR